MNVPLLLEMIADACPNRIGFGRRHHGLSYTDLLRQSRSAARWLTSTQSGSCVHIGLNATSVPIALFAAAHAGVPFVPLNFRLPDRQLRRLLERTAPSVAIVDSNMVERVAGVENAALVSDTEFERLCNAGKDYPVRVSDLENQAAVLLFTSGTSGEPKAAVLRHSHLSSYVISTVEFNSADENEAALISVPSYHVAGISAILTNLYAGRRIVYLPVFDAQDWVNLVVSEGITQAMVVPTMLERILDVIDRTGADLARLKSLSYGGGRMPQAVIERGLRLLPQVDFVNAYGLTETSSTIAMLGPEDHRRAIESDNPVVRRRLTSVGKPLSSIEIDVRDQSGRSLPRGQSGEIFVRGDQISGEYVNKNAKGAGGWFATKDGGFMDDEGYLFVEGRLDDIIVRGGENISPGEIEDVLRAHPDISDAVVLGVPDNQWGECIAAVVVAPKSAPSEKSLVEWVRKRLRSTKTPQIWQFRSSLPYTDTGKVLRRQLKSEFIKQKSADEVVG